MPATFSLPHLLVFSTLLCLVSSSSSLPPLLPSSHLSLHSPPISALASLVSSCPALVTLPLSSVIGHRAHIKKMHQYKDRDGEEDRKPGGKTRVKEIYGKCGVKGGGRTGQDNVEE